MWGRTGLTSDEEQAPKQRATDTDGQRAPVLSFGTVSDDAAAAPNPDINFQKAFTGAVSKVTDHRHATKKA